MNNSPVLKLNAADDVVIARQELPAGSWLEAEGLETCDLIPAGHKIALHDIAAGSVVKRYGQIIGFATRDIRQGEHIHVHNLGMGNFERDYAWGADSRPPERDAHQDTFMGIRRADGRVATRNFIGVLSSVNCSATVVRAIEDHFRARGLSDFPNVDGIVALPQSFGCAFGSDSEMMTVMRRTIAGYATHVNFAGIVLVGLGCESFQIKDMMNVHKLSEGAMFHTLTIQESGGTRNAIQKGISLINDMLPEANRVKREPVPVSEIILALECGGSDSYSGISANPALGYAVDRLVRQGGTAILSETSEIYGAEHLLTRRAISREVGEKLIRRIKWWEDYCERTGSEMNNNPSAGNKAGGLTTVLEKSLGGIAKAGTTSLMEVYEYAEPVTAKGVVFMDTPGYDPMAVTGQIAGGANLVCFTTGRGSAFGSKPTPCLKIATNNTLWHRQQDDMDVNCGTIVEGEETIEQAGERIYQRLIGMASGARTRSEELGYGSQEFVPWIMNAIM
ncbi:altronate dehydratase [Salmonella enterica]|uniref:UxaA family hydrolase n=1 Tax=Enterobacteriaceae TaxID=543 RepID=UPI000FC295A8|nr:altronate dehydratase family protein [Salmonella enterica]EBW3718713.1 altronate dehydratase [Salmonella enterica subsp. enterica serovar Glostrup]EBW7590822.1 altronate dehydratase [Salmonella enterica subsp. salamae serovar Sofia]MLP36177.1 altronate dehydratase [Salmonella enterica subsp. enterica serovar Schwarzengrund]EEF6303520.1 altronate dehydratase [Salmonella enterica]EHF1242576.1 altronate dehydratase [Salmonella enterica]